MSLTHKIVFLLFTLAEAYAGNSPTNIIGINNIIDIPNKISGIAGFGSKDNSTSDGTTTVMGTNFASVIPDKAQHIFGANKTGDKGNDTSSGIGSIGSNFGSIISSIPNKFIGQNKTGVPDFGSIVSSFPDKVFGNNKTSENGTESGWPNFGSIVSGIPDKVLGKNKTNSENGTDSGSNGWPDFGSIISGVPDKIFGKNKTNSENGTDTGSNGWPNFGSVISGIPDKVFGSNKTSSGNETNTESGSESVFPNFGLGNKKNCSGHSSIIPDPTGGIPDYAGIIPGFPHETKPTDSKNSTSGEDGDHKPRSRRCHHCNHKSHEEHTEHDEEKHSEPENLSRSKRQTSIASALGSGGTGLGSLVPGGGLGSSGLASNLAGDATLVMGMFQVLVKPFKLPGIDGIMDAVKNPQTILTQPQSLLNGGKN